MSNRKIRAMHSEYGIKIGFLCKDCENLLVGNWRGKKYKKCLWYGLSHSEATDWAFYYIACGKYGIPFDENNNLPLMGKLKREPKAEESPIDGQIIMFEEEKQ